MILCGIDAGKTGCVAIWDTDEKVPILFDTQIEDEGSLDCEWFFDLLMKWKPDHAIIEAVYQPNSLVRMHGEYTACLKLFGAPLLTIAVVTWKKAILNENTNEKKKSIQWAKKLFPTIDLMRPTPAGKKIVESHDRAEAALLAETLRRTLTPSPKKSGKAS